MLDLEITLHRGDVRTFRAPVDSAADAFAVIFRYLACCWGIPLPRELNEAAIAQQITTRGEYRRDHEQHLIVVKPACVQGGNAADGAEAGNSAAPGAYRPGGSLDPARLAR